MNQAHLERRARRFWGAFVVGLLTMSVSMWGYAVYLGVTDNATAIVPDYHQRALDWDRYARSVQASRELGWVVQFVPGKLDPQDVKRIIELFVRDSDGQLVRGCSGTLKMYHLARASAVYECELSETEPGTYSSRLPIERSGQWHCEVELHRDAEHFHWSEQLELELR